MSTSTHSTVKSMGSVAKIIDIQLLRRRNEAELSTSKVLENWSGQPSRNSVSELGGQQPVSEQSAPGTGRWNAPSGGHNKSAVQQQQEQQGGENLSSFESDYDLLVYLGETETEDIVDTERSLDYQDQTWRQSICGGASLAPTIDESLSELIGSISSSQNQNQPSQTSQELLEQTSPFAVRGSPLGLPLSSPLQLRSASQNQLIPADPSANQLGPDNSRAVWRQNQQSRPRTPVILAKGGAKSGGASNECDNELLSVLNEASQSQQPARGFQAGECSLPRVGLQHWQACSTGQIKRMDEQEWRKSARAIQGEEAISNFRQESLAQPKLANFGDKLASLFNRRPANQRQLGEFALKPDGGSGNDDVYDLQIRSQTLRANSTSVPPPTSANNPSFSAFQTRDMYEPNNMIGQQREQSPQKDVMSNSDAAELDRLLAEMSQSLDLDSLARYDPQSSRRRVGQPSERQVFANSSQNLDRHEPARHLQAPIGHRSLGRVSEQRPLGQARASGNNDWQYRHLIKADGRKQGPNDRGLIDGTMQLGSQKTSNDSILDEYDGASRMLELMIIDQLEESSSRKQEQQHRLNNNDHARQLTEGRKFATAKAQATEDTRMGEAKVNLNGPTSTNQSGADQTMANKPEIQQEHRKVSTCSSSVATLSSVVAANKVSEQSPPSPTLSAGKHDSFTGRSVWRHKRSAKGKQTEEGRQWQQNPISQGSFDQQVLAQRGSPTENRLAARSMSSLRSERDPTSEDDRRRAIEIKSQRVRKQAGALGIEQREAEIPPPLPKVDYESDKNEQDVIRVEAAELSSSSSSSSGSDDEKSAKPSEPESQLDRMKRRTMSSMRSMREKLSDFMGGEQRSRGRSSTRKQSETRQLDQHRPRGELAAPPQPPKRSSSIGSRTSGQKLSPTATGKPVAVRPPEDLIENEPNERKSRSSRRGRANPSGQSFGQLVRERLSRSKSRIARFLKPASSKRAQSSPNKRETGEERAEDAGLFQPGDIARNCEPFNDPDRLPSDRSFNESLDRHLAANIAKRERKSRQDHKRSSESSISGLDISRSRTKSRKSLALKSNETRSSSLLSIKRLSLGKNREQPERVMADLVKPSSPKEISGRSKRKRRKKRRRGNGNKSDTSESSGGSHSTPLAGPKLATPGEYLSQSVGSKRLDRREGDSAHEVSVEGNESPTRKERPAIGGEPGQENGSARCEGKAPARSLSLRSFGRGCLSPQPSEHSRPELLASNVRTMSSSNLNRQLPVTNSFRPLSACAKLEDPTDFEPDDEPKETEVRNLVTPVGPTNSELSTEPAHLLPPPDHRVDKDDRVGSVSPMRVRGAAILGDFKSKCNELFGSRNANLKCKQTDLATSPPIRPPRKGKRRVRSKSTATPTLALEEEEAVTAAAATTTTSAGSLTVDLGEHPADSVKANKLANLAQQLRHSAADFFMPNTSGARRCETKQRGHIPATTPATATLPSELAADETNKVCDWKPVIQPVTSAKHPFRFGSVKTSKEGTRKELGEPTDSLGGVGSARACIRQHSLDTDSTWESSELDEGNEVGVVQLKDGLLDKADSSGGRSELFALESVDLQSNGKGLLSLPSPLRPPPIGQASSTERGGSNSSSLELAQGHTDGENYEQASGGASKLAIEGIERLGVNLASNSELDANSEQARELKQQSHHQHQQQQQQQLQQEVDAISLKSETPSVGEQKAFDRRKVDVESAKDLHNEDNFCNRPFKFSAHLPPPLQIIDKDDRGNDRNNNDDSNSIIIEQRQAKAEQAVGRREERELLSEDGTEALVESLVNDDASLAALLAIQGPNREQVVGVGAKSTADSQLDLEPQARPIAPETMATVAMSARETRKLDEADAQFLKAMSHIKIKANEQNPPSQQPSPKCISDQETLDGSENEAQKRLSAYENVDSADTDLLATVTDRYKTSPPAGNKRHWRRPLELPKKPAHLLLQRAEIQDISDNSGLRCSPPGSPSVWSLNDTADNIRFTPTSTTSKGVLIMKDDTKTQTQTKSTENEEEEAPAKPKRKLVSMLSIIQDPNDNLMVAGAASAQNPPKDPSELAQADEKGQPVQTSPHSLAPFSRRDSTFSFTADDNNSDSDSSYAAAAINRQRLINKFEPISLTKQTNNDQKRTKFPAFNDGKSAISSALGGGESLVKRLARNFDQTVQTSNQRIPKQIEPTSMLSVDEDPRSESSWYDAKSAEPLDEAEVAEFLQDFDTAPADRKPSESPRILHQAKDDNRPLTVAELSTTSEVGSISTGADPFVTVAESTLSNDQACNGPPRRQVSNESSNEDENTLNDDGVEQFGDEEDEACKDELALDVTAVVGDNNDLSSSYRTTSADSATPGSNHLDVEQSMQEQGKDNNHARYIPSDMLDAEGRVDSIACESDAREAVVLRAETNSPNLHKLAQIVSKPDHDDHGSSISKTASHSPEQKASPSVEIPVGSQIIDNQFKNSLNHIIARRSPASQIGGQQQAASTSPGKTGTAELIDANAAMTNKSSLKPTKLSKDDPPSIHKELKGLSKFYYAILGHGKRRKKNKTSLNKSSDVKSKTISEDLIHSSSSSSSSSSTSSPLSSSNPSAATSDDEEVTGTTSDKAAERKKDKRARKCSKLYQELEKILATRLAREQTKLDAQVDLKDSRSDRNDGGDAKFPTVVEDSENKPVLADAGCSGGDIFEEEDEYLGDFYDESLSNTTERDDQISLSSSSVSSESIQEIKQRQNLQKLYHVVNEIYSSEAKFVDTLRLLNVDFREHIKAQNGKSSSNGSVNIPGDCISSLLKHLPQLQALNENLLAELKQARDQWPKTQKIAHVLVKIGPFLKHYSTYIREFESIQQQLNENIKKYPHFAERVKEFEASERSQKLTIQHHLLKPIQRIPQYRLLLQQYLHYLKPDDVDYEDTVNALEVVSRVAEHANQSMCEGANFAKLLALQAKIVGKQKDIVQPGRLFLKEGELMKVCRKQIQPRWFVLLNDALLHLTKIQSSDILYLNNELPLDDCLVSAPNESEQADMIGQRFETEFSVCTKTRSFALIAKSRSERDDWINAIRRAIEDHTERRRSFILRKSSTYPNVQVGSLDVVVSANQDATSSLLGQKAPLWVPDSRVTMCQLCTSSFSTLFRRHHCRCCGQVVCSACSSNRAPLIYLKCRAKRVCDQCYDQLKANIHLYHLPSGLIDATNQVSGERELRRLEESFRAILRSQFVRHAGLRSLSRLARNSSGASSNLKKTSRLN